MKDWNGLVADQTILTQNFTQGRDGGGREQIQFVVIHHNAGNLSGQQIHDVWNTRQASAHYQVDANGIITQLVDDGNTAWHAGDWETNVHSIGIEHADINDNPWTVSAATLDNGAHLTAAVCKAYGLGRPQWNVNVFPHSHFYQTACPASLEGSQNAEYMSRAQQWYDAMNGGTAPSAPIAATPHAPAAPVQTGGLINVHYALRQLGGEWNDEVTNFNNSDDNGFAGYPYRSHDLFYAYVDSGTLRYRAHTVGGAWQDWVDKGDRNDTVNGCAGIPGTAIDGIQCYYQTPDGQPLRQAWYRSQTTQRAGWQPTVCDDGSDGLGDTTGFAGVYGEPMDRIQLCVTGTQPF